MGLTKNKEFVGHRTVMGGLEEIFRTKGFEQIGKPKLIIEPVYSPNESCPNGRTIGQFTINPYNLNESIKKQAPKGAQTYMINRKSAAPRTLTGDGTKYPKSELVIPIVYYRKAK